VSDPRLPDDGPSWPERDLEENRAEQPAMGWSDDPYSAEPLPPNRPSDEPLEGEWSDSLPFDPEPLEPDPFAPGDTLRQDDPWGFPPRTQPINEPTYEPAPTEPEFESEPAWPPASTPEPEPPAAEGPPTADEPMAFESSAEAPEEPESLSEPAYAFAAASEPEPEPIGETDADPGAVVGSAATIDAEPASYVAPEAEAGAASAEPEAEAEPDRTEEIAAVAAASALAADEPADELEEPIAAPEPELEPDVAFEEAVEPEVESEPDAAAEFDEAPEAEPVLEPEPVPEPEFEREYAPSDEVAIGAATATTAWVGSGLDGTWDPKRDGNRRRPTTAEQAVPWLIGIILALAGMVIVLLALIFTSPNGLVASDSSPSPQASAQPSTVAIDPSSAPSGEATPSVPAVQSAAPTPEPHFGPLEMTYLGRPSAVAPVYLLVKDFSVARDPDVLAQAAQGVSSYAAAPNGRVAASVISGRAVALDRGGKTRRLADNITTVTFGWDAETLYAIRITRDGGNDLAKVLEIDFVSGATRQLATVRYPHPVIGAEAPLQEAQFIDNGGAVRLYAVADGNLTLWVLGAPATYRIDPANGDVTEIGREPILWSPDGTLRVTTHKDGNNTALRLRDRGNTVLASTGVNGLVSHVRWAGTNNEIVFTLGVSSSGGGVRQDLYVWDLEDRKEPMPLTSTGAAFGAEWRGVMSNWGP
jgi:hypothetical protein